jgi:hypothetical protein
MFPLDRERNMRAWQVLAVVGIILIGTGFVWGDLTYPKSPLNVTIHVGGQPTVYNEPPYVDWTTDIYFNGTVNWCWYWRPPNGTADVTVYVKIEDWAASNIISLVITVNGQENYDVKTGSFYLSPKGTVNLIAVDLVASPTGYLQPIYTILLGLIVAGVALVFDFAADLRRTRSSILTKMKEAEIEPKESGGLTSFIRVSIQWGVPLVIFILLYIFGFGLSLLTPPLDFPVKGMIIAYFAALTVYHSKRCELQPSAFMPLCVFPFFIYLTFILPILLGFIDTVPIATSVQQITRLPIEYPILAYYWVASLIFYEPRILGKIPRRLT